MKRVLTKAASVAVVINFLLSAGSAQAVEIDWPDPVWPEIFDPNRLLTLNLQIDPSDWYDILHDSPDSSGCILDPIERPALFWMDGEEHLKIKVSVRRKKSVAFPNEGSPEKVALKIDINEYYPEDPDAATEWHGLKKLSLEANADSVDLLAEGLSCSLHRMASVPEGYGYDAWHVNWAKVYVNGEYKGVYVNNEQRDKQFMVNRGLYTHSLSWLYKYMDCEPTFVVKVGDDDFPKSPALEALCYDPFITSGDPELIPEGGECPVPDDDTVIADMNQWVNMQGMLAMAAVDAFVANSDPLFTHNGNTYFMDFDDGSGRKRMYLPWDVDAVLKSTAWDIYYTNTSASYDEVILSKPVFRDQYNQIMRDLIEGPLSEANIHAFLDMVEPVISDALAADPWAMSEFAAKDYSTVAEAFIGVRSWISERIPNVLAQVEFDDPTPPSGIILLHDCFDAAVWDANWTGSWTPDPVEYFGGSPSAHADKTDCGDFTCDALDANDAAAINVTFWLRKKNITSYNPKLYYYNGTSYDDINDLDALGSDNEWLHYTDTITDSNYFIPDFRIRFSAPLCGGGSPRHIWLDDVFITKETPCSVANLDGVDSINFKDLAMLANDWLLTGSGLAGDIDGNYVTNFDDLDWIRLYWLYDCGQ